MKVQGPGSVVSLAGHNYILSEGLPHVMSLLGGVVPSSMKVMNRPTVISSSHFRRMIYVVAGCIRGGVFDKGMQNTCSLTTSSTFCG